MADTLTGRGLKVGIFTDVYKPVINGVVNAIENLSRSLWRAGHSVYIFAPAYSGYKDDLDSIYRFKSINLLPGVNYPLSIPYSRRIFSLINSLELDIIHCHHPFLLGRVGQYFAKKLGIPVVATLHTQYENYNHYVPLNKEFVKKVTLWALRDFSNRCDMLITPAESRKNQLRSYGISTDIKVIPNAIEPDKYSGLKGDIIREKYSVLPGEKLLLFVGRIAKEKNIDFLFDCFESISGEDPSVKLMMVGDGPEFERLKKKAGRESFFEKIIFTGEIDNNKISDYYGAADIFVSASTTEVHPVVLLEAMASGLPVVAVKSAGYEDTIRDGIDGILCKEDRNDFTGSVISLLRDVEKRRNLGQAALGRVEEFSSEHIIKRMVEVYFSLLKN